MRIRCRSLLFCATVLARCRLTRRDVSGRGRRARRAEQESARRDGRGAGAGRRFTSFRDEVFWHRLEREEGRARVSGKSAGPRSARDALSGQRGGRPLLILDYGNPLYDGGGQLSSAEAIAAWSRYVRFVVKHFKGRVDQFEVWNEWNIGGGGTPAQRAARYGSPEDYAKVLKAAYSAVKAENATATVIGGAFAGYDYKWIEAFARAGGFSSLDAFSAHPYVFAEGKKGTPDSAIRHLDELKALIDRLAPGRNLLVVRHRNRLAGTRGT